MNAADITGIATGVTDTGLSIGSLVAKAIPTRRECTVELSNDTSSYTLSNPSMFIKSGQCSNPLPALIKPAASATALFSKSAYRAQGSIGTFTYDLCDASKNALMKVAVMFKVPFNNDKKHPIMYGVGLFDVNKPCDCDLYETMAKSTGTFVSGRARGPTLTYTSQNITIMASMSNCYTPVVKVHVTDD